MFCTTVIAGVIQNPIPDKFFKALLTATVIAKGIGMNLF